MAEPPFPAPASGLFLGCKAWRKPKEETFQTFFRQGLKTDKTSLLYMETSETNPSGATVERTLTVQNKMGIHARPAAMIVRVTNRFKSEVFFEKDEEQVNGKSIMGLMMLAAGRNSKIKVSAQGEDAGQLLKDLEELFERQFDEG